MKILSKSVAETNKLAEDFVNKLLPRVGSATVVGMFGDLGSGKTTFIQAVGKSLGVEEVMTSPTFVIEKIYLLKNKKFNKLIHIDAYRLDSGKELANLGWEEIIKDPQNLILIEWPERVADILPKNLTKLYFRFLSEFERGITL